MTQLLNQSQDHGTVGPFGKRGDDFFSFTVLAGEVYDSCQLTVQGSRGSSGAQISAQPASGQTGNLSLKVHWFYEAFSDINYQITAFSRVAGTPVGATVRVPGFLPSTAGFHFDNNFPSRPDIVITIPGIGQLGIGDASNGLCGGMAYSVRDFFQAGTAIPTDTNPPTGGPLFDYIVKRLFDSFSLTAVPPGPTKYMELMNPLLPDHETFASNHGLAPHGRAWRMIHDEWPLIKTDLERGVLCPLALVCIKSTDPRKLGQNHQVLAYGYDLNGSNLTLHIYDPDHHDDDTVTLSLDIGDPQHTTPVTYSTGRTVFCFFRTNYTFSTPLSGATVPGHILLFEDRNFGGRYKDVQSGDPDLTASDSGYFNDKVSSIVVLNGNWSFFKDIQFANPYQRNGNPIVLSPGLYSWVEDVGITNDDLSSLKAVTDPPND